MGEITVKNAVEMLESDTSILLVDVRSRDEFAAEHIPNSINIPLDEIEQRHDLLKGYSQILLLCRSGARSSAACILLKDFFTVTNIRGGIQEWKELGYQVEKDK
ncbi:rhodanese-like domain-containing protein [Candidatus Dojkabacteria bacterium]|uniref:Rhodanese-like domain-containing protein n=1 Tax=Candidatus Dojkabacteria bacterium TaxID=2099670 RepID=A0A955RJV5_9BACT|nr:rhodanese-like domain-containing protein [Candidatus Dojkabacteria bacterium]